MIRINLLPDGDKKGKAKPRPGGSRAPERGSGGGGGGNGVSVLLFLVLAGGAAGVFYWSHGLVEAAHARLEEKKKALDDIQKKIDSLSQEAKDIQAENDKFQRQLVVLEALDPKDRILWSEKLNMIAKLTPKEVFLNELVVDEQVTEEPTKASLAAQAKWQELPADKRGPQPELLKKPVISYTVKVTGLTTGADSTQQFKNTDVFLLALQDYKYKGLDGKDRKFMDGVADIGFETFETILFLNEYPVGQFTLVLHSKKFTGNEDTPGPAPAAATQASAGSGAN